MFPLAEILGIGTKLIDKLIPDPEAKANAQLELATLAQNGELAKMNADLEAYRVEQDNLTDRLKADMASDSWWSKNIRPMTLAAILAGYLPDVPVDHQGLHVLWAWQFCRDTYLFWPWFRHDKAGVRDVGLPSPEALHAKFVEVVKAYGSFRASYRAAFLFDKRARLPLLCVPTMAACARNDMLFGYLDELARLIPGARRQEIPGVSSPEAAAETARLIGDFLDG